MKDKVICGCFNITLVEMTNRIHNGISSFEEFQQVTNIGTSCPTCFEKNKELFDKILHDYRLTLIDEIFVL